MARKYYEPQSAPNFTTFEDTSRRFLHFVLKLIYKANGQKNEQSDKHYKNRSQMHQNYHKTHQNGSKYQNVVVDSKNRSKMMSTQTLLYKHLRKNMRQARITYYENVCGAKMTQKCQKSTIFGHTYNGF